MPDTSSRHLPHFAALLFVGGLVLSSPVGAQEAERDFCAARPGKGSPTCILDAGRWQLELGLADYSRQKDDSGRVTSWAAGDLFLRRGITATTELQFGVTTYNRERTTTPGLPASTAEGIGDITLGAAHSLRNPDGSGFSVAVNGYVTLPTGSSAFTADAVEGGVIVPISTPLSDDWSLSLSPEIGVAADSDGSGSHAAYAFAAGVGRGFGDWGLGAELWVSRDDDPLEASTQATFDLTAVWTPPRVKDAQVDFGLNFGLNDESPDIEFGLGVAKRF